MELLFVLYAYGPPSSTQTECHWLLILFGFCRKVYLESTRSNYSRFCFLDARRPWLLWTQIMVASPITKLSLLARSVLPSWSNPFPPMLCQGLNVWFRDQRQQHRTPEECRSSGFTSDLLLEIRICILTSCPGDLRACEHLRSSPKSYGLSGKCGPLPFWPQWLVLCVGGTGMPPRLGSSF